MKLFSPAKLNLFLRVLSKRQDGYHEIASLFQAVDFGDTLTFALSDKDRLTSTNPSIPHGPSNLIFKAADQFRRKTGLHFGLEVDLEKKIPIQSGLGGGSSNAATTLWALNELHGRPVSEGQLLQWASEIGSDVAFFFSQGTAYCTGRGEILDPLPSLGLSKPFWIIKPPGGLSTPAMYQKLQLNPNPDPRELLEDFLSGKPRYHNDFEEPAFKERAILGDLKEKLQKSGYEVVAMTGSGTAFFAIGEKRPDLDSTFQIHRAYTIRRQPNKWY
ncbi:MAG: 4-diphosphocytidyl-2-C-methyl-D-erythritol kinase [Chlamydiae bacterium]|nr:4-diphosphocytidyl-2-C-methyl-D-erythritol kinase [Chlamydiota bacterium]